MRRLASLFLLLAACEQAAPAATGTVDAAATVADTSAEVAGDGQSAADSAQSTEVAEDVAEAADVPPPLDCPTFDNGLVTIQAAGVPRQLRVYLPPEPKGAGVLFLWHGNGGNSKEISYGFGGKTLAAETNAVLVAPDACCNTKEASTVCCSLITSWGWSGPSQHDEALIDQTLACLKQQFQVDSQRVYTMGFSAGGLWSTWLAMHRAETFTAAAIFSGGVNSFLEYEKAKWKIPLLLAYGGPGDQVGNGLVDFFASAQEAIAEFGKHGHLLVTCDHGLGHTVPQGAPKWAAAFLNAHVGQGPSPLTALPAGFPSYCKLLPAKP